MDSIQRLDQVTAKIARAKELHFELQEKIRKYFISNPIGVSTTRDSETQRLNYVVSKLVPLRNELSLITGDTIQNLISGLDHLAYQLVCIGNGKEGSYRHVYFPIAESEARYNQKKIAQTKGMPIKALSIIDSIKPFKGGNDTLWHLHVLNNTDKHRILLAVGTNLRSINIGPLLRQTMLDNSPDSKLSIPELDLHIVPSDNFLPVKVGEIIFTDLPNAEPNSKIQFVFEIIIADHENPSNNPLLSVLQNQIDEVEQIVGLFTHFF